MKIVGTIVDRSFNLMGVTVSGTGKELGGFGNEQMERQYSIQELLKMGFKNSQVEVSGAVVVEKAGFHFRDMPMMMYDGANFNKVENEINIRKRVLVNGELKGFEIEWGNTGNTSKYVYADILKLTKWCKPGNFVLRENESKIFIAGKPGVMRLSELPEEEIASKTETGKRKRTSGGGRVKEQVVDKVLSAGGNLLDLYNIIKSCDGLIIKLPDEVYKSTGEAKEKVASGFVALGIGEIGNPSIDFGEKKLNANTTFKKVGNVTVTVNGMPMPMYTFTWSTKSLFVDGKNYVKRFGIGVDVETANTIVNTFGKELITRKITDSRTVDPIMSLTGKKDFVFFEVDSSKLEIMSASDAPKHMMNNKETFETVEKLCRTKAYLKVLKDGLKKTSEMSTATKTKTNKPLFGMFAGMNDVYLNAITEAGIDVFTGAYIKRDKVEAAETESGSGSTSESVAAIEIEYDMEGNNIKDLNYLAVVSFINEISGQPKMCDTAMVEMVRKLEAISNPQLKADAFEKSIESLDKTAWTLKKKIWLSKVAMYTLGEGNLEVSGKTAWFEKASRSKKFRVYECKEHDCEGLLMKLTNINIK